MQVQVCSGKSCSGKFSSYITTRLKNDILFYDMGNVEVIESSCMWQCKKSPNIRYKSVIHSYMNPARASELIQKINNENI